MNQSPGPYPSVTDRELRSAAEAAAGSSQPLYLVRTANGLESRTSPDGGEVLLCVSRESGLSTEPTLASVFYAEIGGEELKRLDGEYDALFWSRAAYEKFVLSYYQSLRVLSQHAMQVLHERYEGSDTIAIAHDLKSKPTLVGSDASLLGHLHVITRTEQVPFTEFL